MKRTSKMIGLLLPLLTVLVACNGGDDRQTNEAPDNHAAAPGQVQWYRPDVGVSWQWQLQGELNDGYVAELYDIDLFDTSTNRIANLQAAGHRVICYFSAGSYEEWRDDAGRFAVAVLGEPLDGWAGERWLDIRSPAIRDIMLTRLDLARDKGCDGVEPDNVDGYSNATGFALTADDQLAYNRFLAAAAHDRGLGIGLKNDLGQVDLLVDDFDFAVNEQCFEFAECDLLAPFVAQGKPVLHAEYQRRFVEDAQQRSVLCADSRKRQFSTLILPLTLDDSFRFSCGASR